MDDTTAPATTAPRILVLDNDETTGFYPLASLLYSMHRILAQSHPPRETMLAYLRGFDGGGNNNNNNNNARPGAGRPGARELLQCAARLKAEGRLDHVVVFTAASDKTGWVAFLVDLLQDYAGVPKGTIEHVVTREHVTAFDPLTGQTLKDLRLVCDDTSNLVMVDDKPQYVHHGRVIAVPPYEQHCPIEALVEKIPCSADGLATAREALREDQILHRPSARDFANDRVLYDVAATLELLFPPELKTCA